MIKKPEVREKPVWRAASRARQGSRRRSLLSAAASPRLKHNHRRRPRVGGDSPLHASHVLGASFLKTFAKCPTLVRRCRAGPQLHRHRGDAAEREAEVRARLRESAAALAAHLASLEVRRKDRKTCAHSQAYGKEGGATDVACICWPSRLASGGGRSFTAALLPYALRRRAAVAGGPAAACGDPRRRYADDGQRGPI